MPVQLLHRTVSVLLLEDDDVFVTAIHRAFQKHRIVNPLYVAADGETGLAMLRGTDGHPEISRPLIIFLDLHLCGMDGLEFLAALRNDVGLEDHVVFVLTNSEEEREKSEAYRKHIAGYLLKTNVGDDCKGVIEIFQNFWKCVELPPERHL